MNSIQVSLLTAGLLFASVVAAQNLSPAAINSAYDKVAPSICTVDYAFEATNRSSGRITKRTSTTLGIIASPDGLIVARGHMQVENVEPYNIRVTVGEGDNEKEYDADLLEKPSDVNIVFLRLRSDEPLSLPAVRFSNVTPDIGMPVAVIGILGSTLDRSRAVQTRFVSSIIETPRTTYCLDTPVPQGFIGGPAIDAQGRVIGVLGYELSSSEGGDLYIRSGHPLLFPTELFAKYIENPPSLPGSEEVNGDDAWLGVFTQPLNDDLAAYWELPPEGGIVVSTIVPGSPASQSGLKRGDVIMNVNGAPTRAKQNREVLAFTRLIREVGAGNTITIKLLRDGEPMTIEVDLAERPRSASEAREFEDEVFGMTVRELTTDVRIRANVPEEISGVLVTRTRSGSWSEIAGIRRGFIVLRIGEYETPAIAGFEEAVNKIAEEKPAEVAVFCLVGQTTSFYRMQPRW